MVNKPVVLGKRLIGDLPASWNYVKFYELYGKPIRDFGSFSSTKLITFLKEGVPFIKSEMIKEGKIDWCSTQYISEKVHNQLKKSHVDKGEILFSKIGSALGKAVVYEGERGVCNSNAAVAKITLNGKLANNYFYTYLLNNIIAKRQFQRLIISLLPRINLGDINGLIFPHPPLPEQQKIVQFLSTWDKAIEKLEALVAAKQKRKKALMQQLLTGKKRFPDFEEEWKEYRLIDVADKKKKWSFTGGPFGSNLKAKDYTSNGVRIIQLQNIGDGEFLDSYKIYTSSEKADELLSCNIYPGDIIISKMGNPVARACFIPDTTQRFLMASDGIRLAVDEEKFNKKFIHDYINFEIFRKKAIEASTGSTRQRIGLDDLRKLTLFIPAIEEQQKIASVLSTADKEIKNHQKYLDALKQQKKGLMKQLLTGKKRVKLSVQMEAAGT